MGSRAGIFRYGEGPQGSKRKPPAAPNGIIYTQVWKKCPYCGFITPDLKRYRGTKCTAP